MTTAAAGTALAADLAGSTPQVVAGMASSSFQARRKSAAAAVVANTAKEQTGQGLCPEELADAS